MPLTMKTRKKLRDQLCDLLPSSYSLEKGGSDAPAPWVAGYEFKG